VLALLAGYGSVAEAYPGRLASKRTLGRPPALLAAVGTAAKVNAKTNHVSDHRGSNSQLIDFEGIEIYPIFTVKIENTDKSST
jgi:hypothetical protein